eukprot:5274288-Prorocentrum_lima.AAC.1
MAGIQGTRLPARHLDCLLANWQPGDILLSVHNQPIWTHEYAAFAAGTTACQRQFQPPQTAHPQEMAA